MGHNYPNPKLKRAIESLSVAAAAEGAAIAAMALEVVGVITLVSGCKGNTGVIVIMMAAVAIVVLARVVVGLARHHQKGIS